MILDPGSLFYAPVAVGEIHRWPTSVELCRASAGLPVASCRCGLSGRSTAAWSPRGALDATVECLSGYRRAGSAADRYTVSLTPTTADRRESRRPGRVRARPGCGGPSRITELGPGVIRA